MINQNSTPQTEPTTKALSPEVMEAAARWQAKKAARLARKMNRAAHPAHQAAIARRVAMADVRLEMTGDAAGYRL